MYQSIELNYSHLHRTRPKWQTPLRTLVSALSIAYPWLIFFSVTLGDVTQASLSLLFERRLEFMYPSKRVATRRPLTFRKREGKPDPSVFRGSRKVDFVPSYCNAKSTTVTCYLQQGWDFFDATMFCNLSKEVSRDSKSTSLPVASTKLCLILANFNHSHLHGIKKRTH